MQLPRLYGVNYFDNFDHFERLTKEHVDKAMRGLPSPLDNPNLIDAWNVLFDLIRSDAFHGSDICKCADPMDAQHMGPRNERHQQPIIKDPIMFGGTMHYNCVAQCYADVSTRGRSHDHTIRFPQFANFAIVFAWDPKLFGSL